MAQLGSVPGVGLLIHELCARGGPMDQLGYLACAILMCALVLWLEWKLRP